MGGQGVCSGGVSAPGVVVSDLGGLVWGVWSGGGGGIPACTEADPLPPVNRMNDRQV